jgi:hypothetical protein
MAGRLATFAVGMIIGVGLLWLLGAQQGRVSDVSVQLAVEGRANTAPSIASDGRVVAIAWGATRPDGAADVFVATSVDAGRSFGPGVRVNDAEGTARVSGEMAPRVSVRARIGQSARVRVLWTSTDRPAAIRLATSEDGGRAFGPSQMLQDGAASGDRGWAALVEGADGEPRAVWLDHRAMAESASGADHHHGHAAASSASGPIDGVEMAQRSAIYISDGRREHAIASGVCYCCKTAVARGLDGRLFLAWRHVYPGNIRDIAFSSSGPGAFDFAPPARVSRDEWQLDGCPDDGPAMGVGPDGTVHLVWPTVVSRPTPHKAIFHASSTDGRSFTPRMRVTAEGRNAAHPQVAVGSGGEVVVLWDEVVADQRRIFVSLLAGGVFSPGAPVSQSGPGSYPVSAFADDTLIVAWVEGAPESSRIQVRSGPAR